MSDRLKELAEQIQRGMPDSILAFFEELSRILRETTATITAIKEELEDYREYYEATCQLNLVENLVSKDTLERIYLRRKDHGQA